MLNPFEWEMMMENFDDDQISDNYSANDSMLVLLDFDINVSFLIIE
jgi:hypothetical protein